MRGPLLLAFVALLGVEARQFPPQCNPCNVQVALSMDKTTYEVGEAIPVKFRVTNSGTMPVSLMSSSDVTGSNDGYAFEITDAAGRPAPRLQNPGIAGMKSIGGLKSVAAGNSDTREILLNYYTARLEPGRYTLKGILEPRHSSQTFREESAPVVFEILPTPDASLRARVSNLAQNSGRNTRTTAALLGFTGHPDAIAPLIEMLYNTDDGVAVGGYDALLYFRAGDVRPRLLDALRSRGPRARLVHLLTVPLQANASEVNPILTPALTHTDSVVRDAAIEGLQLANRPPAPDLFALLAARLSDQVATVRHRATIAVGGYQNAAALEALKGVVNDSDPTVREQAAIAVGWAAQAATPGSATHRDAIEVLRQIIQSGQGPASRQAADWLARVGG